MLSLLLLLGSVSIAIVTATATERPPPPPHTLEIATGVYMPIVNLGGVSSSPSNYSAWLQLGGRGLDTALTYGDATQEKVASAVASSSLSRKEIFITTKVPCCPSNIPYCREKEFEGTIAEDVARDVAILGHIDLLLLHWPCDTYEETLSAYRGLEKALMEGKARSIGVSNFNASLLERLSHDINITPAVNQCGHSIGGHNASHNPQLGGDDLTVKYCAEHGISYSAYSPLGGLDGLNILTNEKVKQVADAHGVSTAQVALRWLVQQNITIVTAGTNPSYLKEDMDVFGFVLTDAEMATLAALR